MTRALGVMLLVAVAVTLALFASTASLPFFSESYSHQGRVAGYSSWWLILDPSQVPFRPLQHGYFCLLVALGPVEPWLARVPAFVLYLASALLVADLARQLGCSRAGMWLALLAYLSFPSIKALVWVAAIGNPGRVVCILAGASAFLRHLERPRAATGIGVLVAQALALGFHQSGIVLAAVCALLAWARAGGPIRRGWSAAAPRLREPWLLALLLLAGTYTLMMGLLWSQRYPHSAPGAVIANMARASLALAPETLRHPAIEGLRRTWGTPGFVFGAAAVLGAALAYVAALRSASPRARALLLAIGLDLLLPALAVGFVVRYAQLAAAFAACLLGLGLDALAARPRARRGFQLASAVLLIGWAVDTVHDVAEYRRAGEVFRNVLADVSAERARVGPAPTVALVDLPDTWGRERDIPLFAWGTRHALEHAGVDGSWLLLRTHGRGASEAQLIAPAQLADLVRRGEHPMLVFDPVRARVVEPGEATLER
jgi:hypothetical protein